MIMNGKVYFYFYFFGNTGTEHAGHMILLLLFIPIHFFHFLHIYRVLLSCPGWPWTWDISALDFQVDGIIGLFFTLASTGKS